MSMIMYKKSCNFAIVLLLYQVYSLVESQAILHLSVKTHKKNRRPKQGLIKMAGTYVSAYSTFGVWYFTSFIPHSGTILSCSAIHSFRGKHDAIACSIFFSQSKILFNWSASLFSFNLMYCLYCIRHEPYRKKSEDCNALGCALSIWHICTYNVSLDN